MKISLVYPLSPIRAEVLPPIGLAYLSAYVLNSTERIAVDVIDLNAAPDADLLAKTREVKIVGIGTTFITYEVCLDILKKVKAQDQSVITVIGGPHASYSARDILKEDCVDFVVIGEGEETFSELCRVVARGDSDYSRINGLAFRSDDTVVVNWPRPLIQDLDSIPYPNYDFIESMDIYRNKYSLIHDQRRSTFPLVTSRGCPYQCSYCFSGVFGKKWRARSPENVVGEWEYLVKKRGAEEIVILDDAVNMDMERLYEICDRIVKRKLAIPWSTPNGVRADHVDERLLRKMKESGCYKIAFGVESGNEEILKGISKHIKLDSIRKAFRLCATLGLETSGFFMLGLPGDTIESMQDTIDFAKELNPDYAQFTITVPFPGTRLFNDAREQGLIDEHFSSFDRYGGTMPFSLSNCPPEVVIQMRQRAIKQFYLRPAYICKKLLDRRTWMNPSKMWLGVRRLINYLLKH